MKEWRNEYKRSKERRDVVWKTKKKKPSQRDIEEYDMLVILCVEKVDSRVKLKESEGERWKMNYEGFIIYCFHPYWNMSCLWYNNKRESNWIQSFSNELNIRRCNNIVYIGEQWKREEEVKWTRKKYPELVLVVYYSLLLTLSEKRRKRRETCWCNEKCIVSFIIMKSCFSSLCFSLSIFKHAIR